MIHFWSLWWPHETIFNSIHSLQHQISHQTNSQSAQFASLVEVRVLKHYEHPFKKMATELQWNPLLHSQNHDVAKQLQYVYFVAVW